MIPPASQPSDQPRKSTRSRAGRQRRSARFGRSALAVVALLIIGVLAAACGGRSPSATGLSAAADGSTNNLENSLLAYTNCMRTHGEPNMAEPTVSHSGGHASVNISVTAGSGFDPGSAQFITANNACKHLLPNRASSPETATITPADQADYLKAATCMRSHGILNFPDPTFQDNSVSFNSTTPIHTNSPQYTSALATCEKLIPAGLPYSSPSSGS
jgi:hypothetical protein